MNQKSARELVSSSGSATWHCFISAPPGSQPSGAAAAARTGEPPSSVPRAPTRGAGSAASSRARRRWRRRGKLTLAAASRGRGGWPGSGADSSLRRITTPPKFRFVPVNYPTHEFRVYVHAERVARSWVEHTKPLQPPGRHKVVVFDHLVCARGRSPRRSRPDATIFQLRAGI